MKNTQMKILTREKERFSFCLDSLRNIIIDRFTSEQSQTHFALDKYNNDEFTGTLDDIFQVKEPLTFAEKLVLFMAVTPNLRPGFFEEIMAELMPQGGEFIAFGGIKGQQHRGFLPTGETALYILAGNDIPQRLHFQRMFSNESAFAISGILRVDGVPSGEPLMSGRLAVDEDWLEKILLGKEAAPVFSVNFPARRIQTSMEWEDLILHPQTGSHIQDIQVWMAHRMKVQTDPIFGRMIKPGYRVLFYGKAGTGKTSTATLLGKKFNIPVYRIDLSQVVSKYIGETEKHIELVFSRAEKKNWILFFDEADALFGKRTSVQSSNDKFANQEVSYLLQRIEDFEGLLILASNYKNNIDDAFLRRFHNLIHFPMPTSGERYKLWTKHIPAFIQQGKEINWEYIAEQFEMSGADIINVVYYATLKTLARNTNVLHQNDILDGIKKEFNKQEKFFQQ